MGSFVSFIFIAYQVIRFMIGNKYENYQGIQLRELENHNKNIKEQTIRDIKDEIESGES